MDPVSPSSTSTDNRFPEWQVPDSVKDSIPKTEQFAKSFLVTDLRQLPFLPLIPALAAKVISCSPGTVYVCGFLLCSLDLAVGLCRQLQGCVNEHEENNKQQKELIINQVTEHNSIVLELKKELTTLTNQIQILTEQNQLLTTSNQMLKNQIAELEMKIQQLSIINATLRDIGHGFQNQVVKLEEENLRLTTTIDELQNTGEHIRAAITALHTLREEQRTLVTDMEKLKKEDESRKKELEKEVQELKNLSNTLENHDEKLKEDITKRGIQLKELQQSVAELQKTESGFKTILEGYQKNFAQFTNVINQCHLKDTE